MDRLTSYEVFVSVVERGGFSRAARMLNMSNAMVSEHVAHLEKRVGARLLIRSTRKLQLTADGLRLLPEARRLIETVRDLEARRGSSQQGPAGRVRIDAPIALGVANIAPYLRQFREELPGIVLDLTFGDRGTVMRVDDFDLVVRVGEVDQDKVSAQVLTHTRFIQAASSEYIARKGEPKTPESLTEHDCVLYASAVAPGGNYWRFAKDGKTRWIRPYGAMTLNNGLAIRQAAVDGIGVIQNLEMFVTQEFRTGALQPLLTDWNRDLTPVTVFAEHDRAQSPAVAATMTFLATAVPWPAPL